MVKVKLDLGSFRSASFVWRRGTLRHQGVPCGVLVRHDLGDGHVVTVLWSGDDPTVGLDSLEPLTLIGDFTCSCGDVGTVRDGRWVGEAP